MKTTRWNGPKFAKALDEHLQRLRKHPATKKSSAELETLRALQTTDPVLRKAIQRRVKALENKSGGLGGVLTSLTTLQKQMKGVPEYQRTKRSKSPTKPTKPHKKGG